MSGSVGDNTARASGVIAPAGGGGAWTQISSQTASSDATIDFTTLSADYRDFKIIGSNIKIGSGNADVYFRVDAGSGFATDSNYRYAFLNLDSSGNNTNVNHNTKEYIALCYHSWDYATEYNGAFEVTVYDVHNTAQWKIMHCQYDYWDSSHEITCGSGVASYSGAVTAITGLRVYPGANDFSSGEFTLYGRKIT